MNQSEDKLKIVVLYGDHSHGPAIIHSLQKVAQTFGILIVDDFGEMNRNRYKRYGYLKGIGQKLFIKYSQWLKRRSQSRIDEIKEKFNITENCKSPNVKINDIHDKRLPKIISSQNPNLVVLNCASIIPSDLLRSVNAPFLNIHGGITPLYRGIYGAYWALRDGNEHLVGSTIHKVDEGIDTGEILNQVFFPVTEKDNFSTYNYLQIGYGLEGLHNVINHYKLHGQLPEQIQNNLDSKLHTHPTLLGYLFHRFFRGIK